MPVILVKTGPNKGKVHEIKDAIIGIGRGEDQVIKILDQGVSRQHAEIFRIGEMCFIRDLGSTNGTFLNGKRTTEEMLKAGDEVTVGTTILVFEDKSSSAIIREQPKVELQEGEIKDEKTDTATIELSIAKSLQQTMKIEKPLGKEAESKSLNIIYEVGKVLSSGQDLHNILQKVVELTIDAVSASDGYLFLYDSSSGKMVPRIAVEHEKGTEKRVSRTIARYVLSAGKAVMSTDATLDDRFSLSESVILKKIHSVICAPIIFNNRINGFLYIHCDKSETKFTNPDLELVAAIGLELSLAISTITTSEKLRKGMMSTIRTLVTAIEIVEPKKQGHSQRVADYSTALAIQLGLNKDEIHDIRLSALLHDVGKLSAHETRVGDLKKEHVYFGEKILSNMEDFTNILPGVKYHHEKADGSGFPYGIKNKDTPLIAKIIIVSNEFDNLCTCGGANGESLPLKDVLINMGKKGGNEYDDEVIKALIISHRNGTLYNPPNLFEF